MKEKTDAEIIEDFKVAFSRITSFLTGEKKAQYGEDELLLANYLQAKTRVHDGEKFVDQFKGAP